MQAIVVRLFQMDGTYIHSQSNLRTSLRSFVNYGTSRSGSKAYRNDQLWKTSVESHFVKHIYTVHTRMHTYIHKWTSCMAFKLWNTVELVIGPRPSLLFREIPFNFEFEISSNGTSDVLEINLRITAGNHIPYFEALKKMQGLFKSTENHILAMLLHLQLHGLLFRFQKHLHLTWF